MIRRWREIERWIENSASVSRTSSYPTLPLSELLIKRHETVQVDGALGDWQAITIKFSGEVLLRERTEAFKGAMFAAYPGDLVFSKIDARNGALGLIPSGIPKAVVTSEYPVFTPKADRLLASYLHHLLRADHFKADLQRKASGTSGRKRVTPEDFLSVEVPTPTLEEQDALIAAYTAALTRAAQLEQEAEIIERAGRQAFEAALGVAPPPPLPDRPVFVARFKDVDRWSHEGILRSALGREIATSDVLTEPLGDALLEVRHGCSKGPSKKATMLQVLKISAVTKGSLDLDECKFIADESTLRKQFSLKAGDILMCRTNGTLAYVGMSALVETDIDGMIFPDKIIRVRPNLDRIKSKFLWRLLQVPAVRCQIEAASRTAVGNFAIGGKDIKALNVPLPKTDEQEALVQALSDKVADAQAKRTEAAALRQSAWAAFESALFTPTEESTP
ncbi:MAG: restriction endonuclease subunit S [Betaproteobacteria bacterium]|nr:restriction endonuclease subunit S [Betaproteobacteria bacterium]